MAFLMVWSEGLLGLHMWQATGGLSFNTSQLSGIGLVQ